MSPNSYHSDYHNANSSNLSHFRSICDGHPQSQTANAPHFHILSPGTTTAQTQHLAGQEQGLDPHTKQDHSQQSWYRPSIIPMNGTQRPLETLNLPGGTAGSAQSKSPTSYNADNSNYSYSDSNNIPVPTAQFPSAVASNQRPYAQNSSHTYASQQPEQLQQYAGPSSVNSVYSSRTRQTSRAQPMNQGPRPQTGQCSNHQQVRTARPQRSSSSAQLQASQQLQSFHRSNRQLKTVTSSSRQQNWSQSAKNGTIYSHHQPHRQTKQSRQQQQPSQQQTEQVATSFDTLTVVDPTQVYDHWSEYKRNLDAQAIEEVVRREDEEEAAWLVKLQEGRTKWDEEEAATKTAEAENASSTKSKADKKWTRRKVVPQKANNKKAATSALAGNLAIPSSSTPSPTIAIHPNDPERPIQATMAKIWEEERQNHSNQTQVQALTPALTASAQTPRPVQMPAQKLPYESTQRSAPNPSQELSQLLAQSTQKQGVIWPNHVKQKVAEGAAKHLNAEPANLWAKVQPRAIIELMDRNPSCIELCELLEARGLVLERSSFVRAMMSRVPDLAKSSNSAEPVRQKTLAALSISGQEATATKPNMGRKVKPNHDTDLSSNPAPAPYTNIEHYVQGQWQQSAPSQPGSSRQSPTAWRTPGFVGIENSNHDDRICETPASPQLQPEIVTTTTKSTSLISKKGKGKSVGLPAAPGSVKVLSEDRTSQQPKPKAQAARKRDASDLIDLTVQSSDDELLPLKRRRPDDQDYPNDTGSGQRWALHQKIPQPQISSTEKRFGTTWPTPFAKGKHSAPHIRTASPAQRTALSSLDYRSRGVTIVQPLNREKALRRATYNVATIARDVLLATGKHPDMAPLNDHLEVLKTTLVQFHVDNTSDLDTLRWNVLDPADPIDVQMVDDVASHLIEDDADDESDYQAQNRTSRVSVRPSEGPGGVATVTMVEDRFAAPGIQAFNALKKIPWSAINQNNKIATRSPGSTGRPRGRPPGATNRPRTHESSPANPSRTRAPPAPPATNITASGYAAFRSAQEAAGAGQPKKKGRPVGWRKHLHMKNPGESSKAKYRPTMREEPTPPPKHSIFPCGWKDCGAKLHNLTTLRQHVMVLHANRTIEGVLPCLWNGCGKTSKIVNRSTGGIEDRVSAFSFADRPTWDTHIENWHVAPIGWTLGDGAKAGFSDGHDSEVNEDYLSDRQGRQVTPHAVVPQHLRGMTPEQARAQVRAAAAQSSKKAEREYLAKVYEAERDGSIAEEPKDEEMEDP